MRLIISVTITKTVYSHIQAVIDVNTKGVEAAAATAISVVPYSFFQVNHCSKFLIVMLFLRIGCD